MVDGRECYILATWEVGTGRAILVTSPNTLSAGKDASNSVLGELSTWHPSSVGMMQSPAAGLKRRIISR